MVKGLFSSLNRINGFNSAFKNPPFEENSMLATKTLETNVGAKPDYFPVVTSTRMFFSETDGITEFYFQRHNIVIYLHKNLLILSFISIAALRAASAKSVSCDA